MEDEKLDELLAETHLDIKNAIQIAKILCHAPDERLPMILDVFDIAGVEISGVECIETLKDALAELARRNDQIENLEGLLSELEKLGTTVRNGFVGIPVKKFETFCGEQKISARKIRRTLDEMGLLDTATHENGKRVYSLPVYVSSTKEIIRCVCIRSDWKDKLGVK